MDVGGHELISLAEPARWDATLAQVEHAPAHTRHHVEAFQHTTGHETALYAWRDQHGRATVVCALAVRGAPGEQDAYTPYGFSGFATAGEVAGFLERWDGFAQTQGWVATYLLQHPLLPLPEPFPPSVTVLGGDAHILDLSPEPRDILRGMSSNRRAELVRWDRERDGLVNCPEAITEFLIAEAPRFFSRREASSVYAFDAATWSALVRAPNVVALGVLREGVLAAVSLFSRAERIGEYLFAISRPGAESLSAPLIWEGSKALRSVGTTALHLGGGVRPGDGVDKFKRRFGTRTRPIRHLRLVHREDAYRELCSRAATSPDAPGFFPPYRKAGPWTR